jgi:glyoxylase-like metal-dependent hydrolase (beta-lactamase superfamily II)/rhodanese-related sulfurtransferase
MIEQRFYVEGLAHASYLFGADGEAAIVDPKRDVDDYLRAAQAHGLKIVAIFETHPHADFASGHLELAQRTGATIYISHLTSATYEHRTVREGDVVRVGALEVVVMETPGHSPDSIACVVREHGSAVSVFTGDTLFVGDVGRPDLRDADAEPAKLAAALHHSLFEKLLSLPDETKVLPTHGAGSLCGRNISAAESSTIGHERRSNWALQLRSHEEFVQKMLANLPERPGYFAHDVAANLRGNSALSHVPEPGPWTEKELAAHATRGGSIIDTRAPALFGEGHFPGSLNIGIDGALFATWVGFLVPFDRPLALVVDNAAPIARARLELARIGYDHLAGFIEADSLSDTAQISQLSVNDLQEALRLGVVPRILDVRNLSEWDDFHIESSIHIPLPKLQRRLAELPKEEPLAVICGGGYRSSIATSLLQAHGFHHPQNVMGGMSAYRKTAPQEWSPAELVYMGQGI